MKKWYGIVGCLIVVNLVVSVACIMAMPETVPLHFDLMGEVNRVGSKYENWVFTFLTVLVGVAIMVMAKFGDKDNEKLFLKMGSGLLVFLNAFSFYLFFGQIFSDKTTFLWAPVIDVSSFCVIASGLLLVFLGNLMPKATMNSVFGIRTSWSMSNDQVWQKTQRFGGYATLAFGFSLIVCGLLFSGAVSFFVFLGLLLVFSLVCLLGSYKLYQKYGG